MFSLGVRSAWYQHFCLMDVRERKGRGQPCADEALEVKMLVKLLQTTFGPGRLHLPSEDHVHWYEGSGTLLTFVRTSGPALGTGKPPWKTHGRR